WSRLGHDDSLLREPFPVADPGLLVEASVTCVLPVAGKVRGRIEVAPDISEGALRELALAGPAVQRNLDGRGVRTAIVRAAELVTVVPAWVVFSRGRASRVAIVTDSPASSPAELAATAGVRVVPLDVVIGGERLVEGEGDTDERLVRAL